MKAHTILKLLLLFATSISINKPSFAQTDTLAGLLKDEAYFRAQEDHFKKWLSRTNLSEYIFYDTLLVNEDKLRLFLNIRDLSTWKSLAFNFDTSAIENAGEALGTHLFNKFLHIMDVPFDSVDIEVNSINQLKDEKVRIVITAKEGRLKVYAPVILRKTIRDSIPIRLNRLDLTSNDKIEANIEQLKQTIIGFFKNYYKDKGVIWGKAYCSIQDNDNALSVRVTNIKGEIFNDCGLFCYFELIRFNITLIPVNGEIKIRYDVQGKYGSGIFSAPRRDTSYLDIEEVDGEYLVNYAINMKKRLRDAINKNIKKP